MSQNQSRMGKLTKITLRTFEVEKHTWAHGKFIKIMPPCEAFRGILSQAGIPPFHLIIALLSFKEIKPSSN